MRWTITKIVPNFSNFRMNTRKTSGHLFVNAFEPFSNHSRQRI